MAFILNIIFFLFIIALVVLLFFVLHIVLAVKKVKDRFRRNSESDYSTPRASGQGDHITDTRDPSKAHRKIIADDEGEYVDFVEE